MNDNAHAQATWIRVLSVQESRDVTQILKSGLTLVDQLGEKLTSLNDLMLTGKPHEIATSAAAIDILLRDAAPHFAQITQTMKFIGADKLQTAAESLRAAEHETAASLAEALRQALARIAKRTADANRRAAQLNRGINNALKTLHALGHQENGRLIAEA
jgi:hypothetical protein